MGKSLDTLGTGMISFECAKRNAQKKRKRDTNQMATMIQTQYTAVEALRDVRNLIEAAMQSADEVNASPFTTFAEQNNGYQSGATHLYLKLGDIQIETGESSALDDFAALVCFMGYADRAAREALQEFAVIRQASREFYFGKITAFSQIARLARVAYEATNAR